MLSSICVRTALGDQLGSVVNVGTFYALGLSAHDERPLKARRSDGNRPPAAWSCCPGPRTAGTGILRERKEIGHICQSKS